MDESSLEPSWLHEKGLDIAFTNRHSLGGDTVKLIRQQNRVDGTNSRKTLIV